ncbi:MAG: hypothetical protein V2A74_11285, partial [bacterium]
LPILAGQAINFWYNQVRYGSIWATGYHYGQSEFLGFHSPLYYGVYGLLLSSGKGLFVYCPVLLLGFWFTGRFLRRRPLTGILAACIAISGLALYAKWHDWHGGWCWGARYLLFAVPVAGLMLCEVFEHLGQLNPKEGRAIAWRLALGLCIAWGIITSLLGTIVDRRTPYEILLGQVPFFQKPFYDEYNVEVTDTTAHMHFIPAFSPILINYWTLRSTLLHRINPDVPVERYGEQMPWMFFNHVWGIKVVRPFLHFDSWTLLPFFPIEE